MHVNTRTHARRIISLLHPSSIHARGHIHASPYPQKVNGIPEPRPEHELRRVLAAQHPQQLARRSLHVRIHPRHETHEPPPQRPPRGVQRRHVLRSGGSLRHALGHFGGGSTRERLLGRAGGEHLVLDRASRRVVGFDESEEGERYGNDGGGIVGGVVVPFDHHERRLTGQDVDQGCDSVVVDEVPAVSLRRIQEQRDHREFDLVHPLVRVRESK
mmetsp:Transcript_23609/g.49436  ORF Transcript_23609/g.49436 Transcript_23609/m.49436 type:complete len:215 (-) Transcript_23609:752-1396(-)